MIYCMGCMEQMEETQTNCPHCGYDKGYQNHDGLLPTGTVLKGRYIVGRSIGNGGFGVTYIGLDGQLNRKVAIKEFYPNKLAVRSEDGVQVTVENSQATERFQKGLEQFLTEAQHLARLSHIPGIVYIYNYFYENSTGYIIMEYLEGMDLRTLLKLHGGKLPFEEARELVLSVLFILKTVHMNGILHRDIAPDNVFVTADKVVKLIDFGAARHATRGQDDNVEVLLKVGYAPVEQYSLDGVQGAWTDMYEVGALFYRMITGVKPMPSIERQEEDKLLVPSEMGIEIPPEAEAAIMTSLNVESDYRIQSARDFMEALGGQDFRPTEWTVETTVYEGDCEVKNSFMTKKKIAILIASCVLILFAGGVVAWKQGKEVSVVATNMKMCDVIGKSEEEAKELLRNMGVSQVRIRYIFSPLAEDLIEYQNPESGASISVNEEVTLTVMSQDKVTLPEINEGKEYSVIRKQLSDMGIRVKRVEEWSDHVEKDMVIGYQGFQGGETIKAFEYVPIIVSAGKETVSEPKETKKTSKKRGDKLEKNTGGSK